MDFDLAPIEEADHAQLLANPIYRGVYDRLRETLLDLDKARDELRIRTEGYDRLIAGYKECVRRLKQENDTLLACLLN